MKEQKNHDALPDHLQAEFEALQPGATLVPLQPAVAKVIEETLTEARLTVLAGECWPLTTRIIHPHGIQTLRASGYEGTLEQKEEIAITNEATRQALNASAVVMVTDAWASPPEENCHPSLSPNRSEALIVLFWGADHISWVAAQPYTRLNGDVDFQPLSAFEVTPMNPFCTRSSKRISESKR